MLQQKWYNILRSLANNQVCRNMQLYSKTRLNKLHLKKLQNQYFPLRSVNVSTYLLDETNGSEKPRVRSCKYTERSYNCGELRPEHIGQNVTICGWLEYQRMNKFIVIRDAYGQTQLILKEQDLQTHMLISTLPLESVLKVQGTVLSRPTNMINKKQKTGEIEVEVESLIVLNRAQVALPFNIREFQKASEALCMQYRYLALRFSDMQRNLRVRSRMIMEMRRFLIDHCNFVDVETPTLFKATPGGAQEFVVPTRIPGHFFSLVQSPQQFKQMLMAGGIDRYFQIARCYRDEGSRSDRQPEFTQLDIEMSFTSVDGVIQLIEELLQFSWPDFLPPLPRKFPRMTFKDAIETYGTDKPDLRYDYKLKDCTEIVKTDEPDFGAYYLTFSEDCVDLSKTIKDRLSDLSKKYPKAKLLQNKVTNVEDWITKTGKILGPPIAKELSGHLSLQKSDVVFLVLGHKEHVLSLLGKVREEYVNYLESKGKNIKKGGMHPLWVVDFPLFEKDIATGNLTSAHHPFTAPQADDANFMQQTPLQVRAQAYDLVLNGNEIGGGSIRIHNPEQQAMILDMLGIEKTSLQHMLDMLRSGCPPHGGIALGLDRLISTVLNTTSIRDVIAFPKTYEGRDPVSGAPSPITPQDQRLYHIKVVDS